jgi:hypothetical protein
MKLLYVLLAFVIIASATATAGFASNYNIPDWTKNTALFWGEGYIDDGEYIQFLQFLMDEEILVVPYDNSAEIAQLENQVTGLESELSSLKSSLASDLQGAYNDGYSAGVADQPASAPTSAPVVDTGDEVTVVPAQGSGAPGCEVVQYGCFVPGVVTVSLGDTIVFSNTDYAAHTFTAGSPAAVSDEFDTSMIMAGQSYEWTADVTGEIDYYCMVHPWMIGLVIVN